MIKSVANNQLIPLEVIERRIFMIRGYRIMIDNDIARLYGVSTKRLNEQVKRNRERFPKDFMFRLTKQEKAKVVANCDHLWKLKFSSVLPYAFTEHGAVMAANILNSSTAVHASIQVVRAFVRIRELVTTHKDLLKKMEKMEKKYDIQFKIVFDAIKDLMNQPISPSRRIGFSNS